MSIMRAPTDVAHHDASRLEEDPAPSERRGLANMEIGDYLRIIRKRFWLVLLIPALAVAVAATLILGRPTEHAATATVSAGSIISSAPGDLYATANGSQQFVADFVAATSVPPVIDTVSDLTDTSPDVIRGNVTATPIGESTLIEIRYVTTERSEAGPVVHALALETLRFLFRPTALGAASELDDEAGAGSVPTEQLELMLAQEETVSVSPTQVEPRGPELVRGVQVALGSGLLLGLLVVILLEILPSRRTARRASPDLARPSRTAALSPVGEHERERVASTADAPDGRGRAEGPYPLARMGDPRRKRAPQMTRERRPAAGQERRSEGDRPTEGPPDDPKGEPPADGSADGSGLDAAGREARKSRATKSRRSTSSKPERKGSATTSSTEEDGPAGRKPDEPKIEPPPRVGSPEDVEPVRGRATKPRARKPRAAKTRPRTSSKPKKTDLPSASSPEGDAVSPTEVEVVATDAREGGSPADGRDRSDSKSPKSRKRRPSRAEARRAAQGHDDRPPESPTHEPEPEASGVGGSSVATGATRAVEDQDGGS